MPQLPKSQVDSNKGTAFFFFASCPEIDGILSPRVLYLLTGLLLIATAFLKFWTLLTDPFPELRVDLPVVLYWMLIGLEFWLAAVNLLARDSVFTPLLNVIIFSIFGIFATLRWISGNQSCGCAGTLDFPVWVFVLLDIAIVAAHLVFPFHRSRVVLAIRTTIRIWKRESDKIAGRIVGTCLFTFFLSGLHFLSLSPYQLLITGNPPLTATMNNHQILTKGQEALASVAITNQSTTPTKLIGKGISCKCVDVSNIENLPPIPGGETISIPLVIKPTKRGTFRQQVDLFIDHPEQNRVSFQVKFLVKEAEQ